MIPRYSTEQMSQLWSPNNKYSTWFEIELATLKALCHHKYIPDGIYEKIKPYHNSIKFDINAIEEIEKLSQHDVIAFLIYLERIIGEDAKWIHYGLTSSDIIDTSLAITIKKSLTIIIHSLEDMKEIIKQKAIQYADVLCIGRTHGMHAEPTSFGLKFASFYAQCCRDIERLKEAIKTISVGNISGAVGNYAHIPMIVEEEICESLGLNRDTITTQIINRDRHAYVMSCLGILAGLFERISLEIRHLQRTEIGEVREPFLETQRGSSAMPHKKNPILSENITGLTRLLKSYISPALDNIALWHERDISHSSVERVNFPDAFHLCDFIIKRTKYIIQNLYVDIDAITNNMRYSYDTFHSQTILLSLIHTGLSRHKAYTIVQKSAHSALKEKKSFIDIVCANTDIIHYIKEKDIREICNNKKYLAHTKKIFQKIWE